MGKLDELRAMGDGGRAAAGHRPHGSVRRPLFGEAQLPPEQLLRPDTSFGWLAPEEIDPDPEQPRKEFDAEELRLLGESLKGRHGQLQPLRVRWDAARGRFVVIIGERRWRAARLAGVRALACWRIEVPPGPEELRRWLREEQLIENVVRVDLSAAEVADGLVALKEEHGWTNAELAQAVNRSEPQVSKLLTIARKGGSEVRAALAAGEITGEVAYQCAREPAEEQPRMVERLRRSRAQRDMQALAAPAVKHSETFRGDGWRAAFTAEAALTDATLERIALEVLERVRQRRARPAA